MTAQEAAKACMALVEDACKSAYIVRPWLMEREFTEIISQVTPTAPIVEPWLTDERLEQISTWRRRAEAEQRKNIALAQLALTCNRFPQEIEEPRSEAFRHKLEQAAADANAPMRVAFPWGMIWRDLKAAWQQRWFL